MILRFNIQKYLIRPTKIGLVIGGFTGVFTGGLQTITGIEISPEISGLIVGAIAGCYAVQDCKLDKCIK